MCYSYGVIKQHFLLVGLFSPLWEYQVVIDVTGNCASLDDTQINTEMIPWPRQTQWNKNIKENVYK